MSTEKIGDSSSGSSRVATRGRGCTVTPSKPCTVTPVMVRFDSDRRRVSHAPSPASLRSIVIRCSRRAWISNSKWPRSNHQRTHIVTAPAEAIAVSTNISASMRGAYGPGPP